MMTSGQHGPLEQSYQQPLLSQTIPDLSNEPYVSTMVQIFYNSLFYVIDHLKCMCAQNIQYYDESGKE